MVIDRLWGLGCRFRNLFPVHSNASHGLGKVSARRGFRSASRKIARMR
jgi:hypothetical protein